MTRSPELAISSTQISLESTVPWLNGGRCRASGRPPRPGIACRGLSVGTSGRSGPSKLALDHSPFAEPEEIDADLLVLEKLGVLLGDLGCSEDGRQAGVGADEEVVVDLAAALAVEILGPEVVGGYEIHVALDAARLGDRRVIEAPCPVARDAREQEGVVVVLAADEILVVVQREGQAHLVAGRAELGVLDRRLQERLLVHLGLGLDQRRC